MAATAGTGNMQLHIDSPCVMLGRKLRDEVDARSRGAPAFYVRRLEKGRFLWPSPADGVVAITPAQMGYLLSGIDWRNPVETWRPTAIG
jgi:transposase